MLVSLAALGSNISPGTTDKKSLENESIEEVEEPVNNSFIVKIDNINSKYKREME
jgi:hypothetical protein